jgi:hypothetical protein
VLHALILTGCVRSCHCQPSLCCCCCCCCHPPSPPSTPANSADVAGKTAVAAAAPRGVVSSSRDRWRPAESRVTNTDAPLQLLLSLQPLPLRARRHSRTQKLRQVMPHPLSLLQRISNVTHYPAPTAPLRCEYCKFCKACDVFCPCGGVGKFLGSGVEMA